MPRNVIPLRDVIAAQHTALIHSRQLLRECVFLPGADAPAILLTLRDIEAALDMVSRRRAQEAQP